MPKYGPNPTKGVGEYHSPGTLDIQGARANNIIILFKNYFSYS